MSVVYITNHNENIYDIDVFDTSKCTTDPQIVHRKRIVKYLTKYHQNIKMRRAHGKQQHATMGLAEIPPPLPGDYLRKHTGHISYTQNKAESSEKPTSKKNVTKLPTREEIDELNKKREEYRRKQTSRNHIVENIKNVKVMDGKPKQQQNYIVIDQYGTKRRIIESLMLKSKVFGKTPRYLKTFIEHQKKCVDEMRKAKEEAAKATKCKQITPEEREKILQGLKHNWAELQKEFQCLPILTDTIPKVLRKVKLEKDLKQLEKDIDLIEHHPYIYIYDDDDDDQ